MHSYSPLRYPGGKAKLYNTVKQILKSNDLIGGTYVEPFAGGSGLALKLLFNGDVKRIILNDLDTAIYIFWKNVLNNSEMFCKHIDEIDVSVEEWNKQKEIFKRGNQGNEFEFAFSVFYLNRTNISGILNGGIIGGVEQKGNYKIDARFNKENLKKTIKTVASRKDDIVLYNLDAKELIDGDYLKKYRKIFINFDPPYVNKGSQLYKNSFKLEDHMELYQCIKRCTKKWIVTYDVCDFIRDLYKKYRQRLIEITYSAKTKTKKEEFMFFSKNLIIPDQIASGGSCMQCTDNCRFCSIQKGEKVFDIIDAPILENENYYLLSSVGALVEGWCLVIPKEHQYSMKDHYLKKEFYAFINECIDVIKRTYSVEKVIVFEHGANKFGSMTACGTNHCHIHIVPLKESLIKDIKDELAFEILTFGQLSTYVKESEYLLYADTTHLSENTQCYTHILKEPTSQFFRRVIAKKIGCPDRYNYKEYNNIDISNATFKTLQKGIKNG